MMKVHLLLILALSYAMVSCVSIPKETITLSQTLGRDLQSLQKSHQDVVLLYYDKIEDNINTFVDEVYAPFIINYMLKSELKRHEAGEESLYGVIETGGTSEEKEDHLKALNTMREFQEALFNQINSKKEELLKPLQDQEVELLGQIKQSYDNVTYANVTITNYLESIGKLKNTHQDAMSMAGLSEINDLVERKLVSLTEKMNDAVNKGKKIDLESETVSEDIKSLSAAIKSLTN